MAKSKAPFLQFHATSLPGALTQKWTVTPHGHGLYGDVLGRVFWHSPWRRYVFEPSRAIFDADCLTEMQVFLRERTYEQKEAAAARRRATKAEG